MTKTENLIALEMIMPTLPEDVISAFMTLATAKHVQPVVKFDFTADQLEALARSRDDIKHGRTMSFDDVFDGIDKELGLFA